MHEQDWSEEEKAARQLIEKMNTPIAELKLAVRIINTLDENSVILVKHLYKETYESLMAMRNFGEKTLREVQNALAQLGLNPPEWKKTPSPGKKGGKRA